MDISAMTQTATYGVPTNLKCYHPDSTSTDPKWDTRPTTIKDLRGHEQEFMLDKHGFEYHTSPTKFTDFGNDAAVRSEYYREVEGIVKKV
jgi:hypothetical protein